MNINTLRTKKSRTRAILAALLFPALLVMSACSLDVEMEFKENNTVSAMMDFKMNKTELSDQLGGEVGDMEDMFTCEEFFSEMESEENYDFTTEDLSTDTEVHCRMISEEMPFDEVESDEMTVTNEGGVYTVVSEGSDDFDDLTSPEMEGMEDLISVSITYVFPGDVTESNVGTIDGNRVTITDFAELGSSYTITAGSSGGGDAQSPDDSDDSGDSAADPDSADDADAGESSSGGMNTGLIIGIIVVALIIIGLIIWLVTRNKNQNPPTQTPPPPAQPGV